MGILLSTTVIPNGPGEVLETLACLKNAFSTAIFWKILIHNNSQKILLFIVADVGQCVSMQASVLVN